MGAGNATSSKVERRSRAVAALRGAIAGIEGAGRRATSLSLGDPALDGLLPGGGLGLGALHEAQGQAYLDGPAALGFLVAIAARALRQRSGGLVWVRARGAEFGLPYAPGLSAAGLDPARLVRVDAAAPAEALWAAEEAAGTTGLAAVLVEAPGPIGGVAARRLQLAAERGEGLLLLWRPHAAPATPAARTRWRIAPRPSAPPAWTQGAGLTGLAVPPGSAAVRAELVRARGRFGGLVLDLEHSDASGGFRLAAILDERAEPARRRA